MNDLKQIGIDRANEILSDWLGYHFEDQPFKKDEDRIQVSDYHLDDLSLRLSKICALDQVIKDLNSWYRKHPEGK